MGNRDDRDIVFVGVIPVFLLMAMTSIASPVRRQFANS